MLLDEYLAKYLNVSYVRCLTLEIDFNNFNRLYYL